MNLAVGQYCPLDLWRLHIPLLQTKYMIVVETMDTTCTIESEAFHTTEIHVVNTLAPFLIPFFSEYIRNGVTNINFTDDTAIFFTLHYRPSYDVGSISYVITILGSNLTPVTTVLQEMLLYFANIKGKPISHNRMQKGLALLHTL